MMARADRLQQARHDAAVATASLQIQKAVVHEAARAQAEAAMRYERELHAAEQKLRKFKADPAEAKLALELTTSKLNAAEASSTAW